MTARLRANRPLRYRLAVGLVLLFAVVDGVLRHRARLATVHGAAVVAVFAVFAASVLAVPRPPTSARLLALLAACAVALQLLAPATGVSLLLFMVAALIGGALPRSRLALSAVVGAVVSIALVLVRSPHASFPDVFSAGFSVAAAMLLTNTLYDLRRSRDERERLYGELQDAYAELRRYAERVEELTVLQERTRLARELHDTLGHALTTLTVHLEAIGRAARSRPESLEPLLEDTRGLTRRAMADLRESLAGLREDAPERPVDARLAELAERAAARAGWRLEVRAEPVKLPPTTAHALLRIAREALANAERHAAARKVGVTLRSAGEALELAVEDDGAGFDPAAVPDGHFGLRGMRERAAQHGARLSVASAPGRGTRITVRLPVAAAGRVEG